MQPQPPPADHTLPRARRLRAHRDYTRTQRQGIRAQTDALILIGRGARPGSGRIGLTVSKKVGGAVVRNLVKRRLRSILRHHKDWFAARDVIVIVQPQAAALSLPALTEAVVIAMRRLDETMAKTRPGGRPGGGRSGERPRAR